ncbi:hypothetical protein JOD64_006172 [Micromonospora luteifusca]|uniref:Uncharacterized protein n=1 Tax=Micromonospora luteifusca TaxID=709860 RepID=A0ABS2M3D1_9ACTN|nr:hypothetical protein [Micromonospora luteifusca]MBM7494950.1 hypothetical protein [Micromonospora luteifusca]
MAETERGKTLRLIGYWWGSDEPGWPDVNQFVDEGLDPGESERVALYLSSGTAWVAAAGLSPCRLCGVGNGSAELTDGSHFIWPEGLAHYVRDHQVRLPAQITEVMYGESAPVDASRFEQDLDAGDLSIDDEWWRTLGDTRPAAARLPAV